MLNFHSFLERNLINYSILNIECYRAKTYELCKKRSFFKTKLNNHLTLSVPEKLKNSIFQIPIVPQTSNIHNQRTTRAESINLDIIRKLIEYSLNACQILFLRFLVSLCSRCYRSKVGQYYDLHNGLQEAKGLTDVFEISKRNSPLGIFFKSSMSCTMKKESNLLNERSKKSFIASFSFVSIMLMQSYCWNL